MCLVLLSWQKSSDYPLVIAANRDERFDRAAAALGWWEDHKDIAGGRDLVAGGTWLAFSRNGRFGVITNFRDPKPPSALRSRGDLIPTWLSEDLSAAQFHRYLETHETAYAGFNLLFGDSHELHYFSNRNTANGPLGPGYYALSNAALDAKWPKMLRAQNFLRTAVAQKRIDQSHFATFLRDSTPAKDKDLPQPFLPIEQRRVLSAPFIMGEIYGTRSTSTVFVDNNGLVNMHEQHFAPMAEPTDHFEMSFTHHQ